MGRRASQYVMGGVVGPSDAPIGSSSIGRAAVADAVEFAERDELARGRIDAARQERRRNGSSLIDLPVSATNRPDALESHPRRGVASRIRRYDERHMDSTRCTWAIVGRHPPGAYELRDYFEAGAWLCAPPS